MPLGLHAANYYVVRVDGDRVRIVHDGREGDARTSDLVPMDQAEAYFSEQIKTKPESSYAYLMRAFARTDKDDWVNLGTDCEQAIRLAPNNAAAFLMRGYVLKGRNEFDAALKDLMRPFRFAPKNAYAFRGRAECYAAQKTAEKAFADINEAITPGSRELLCAIGRVVDLWSEQGNAERALADYNEMVRLSPKSSTNRYIRILISRPDRTTTGPSQMSLRRYISIPKMTPRSPSGADFG